MVEALNEEIEKRKVMRELISSYLSLYFTVHTNSKIRRGTVQKEIGAFFNIKLSTPFCKLINECLQKKGVRLVTNQGDYYYRNLKRIED